MSAATVDAPGSATPYGSDLPPGFRHTLAGEWAKVRALRLYRLLVLAILLTSVAVGVFLVVVGGGEEIAQAQADSEYSVIFYSSSLTTWAFAYLAASFVALEFSGLGPVTFVATPRRHRVLAAKAVLIAIGGLIVGVVTALATAAATQGTLAVIGGQPLDLTEPGLVRAVLVLIGASMAVQGLIAASFAVLTRSAAGGVAIAGLVSLLPVSLATLLGQAYAETVPRWLPGAAVESLAGVAAPEGYGYLSPTLAAATVLAWVVLLGGAALIRLNRTPIG